MKKEKPKMPYILGEPEGLGRGDNAEIHEEEKRLSGGVRPERTTEDVISGEPDPLQRLIEQEENTNNIDENESPPDNDDTEDEDGDDAEDDKTDEDEKNFGKATGPIQEQTDGGTLHEYSDTPRDLHGGKAARSKLIKPRGIGEHPPQKPHYKDKIGRNTIRGQNPNK